MDAGNRATTVELLNSIDDLLPGSELELGRAQTDDLLQGFDVPGTSADISDNSKTFQRNTSDDIFQNFLSGGGVPALPSNGSSHALNNLQQSYRQRTSSSRMTNELKNLLEDSLNNNFDRTPSEVILEQILAASAGMGMDGVLQQQGGGASQGMPAMQNMFGGFTPASNLAISIPPVHFGADPSLLPPATRTGSGVDAGKEATKRNAAAVIRRLRTPSGSNIRPSFAAGPPSPPPAPPLPRGQRTQQQLEEMLAQLRKIIPLQRKGPVTRSRSTEIAYSLAPFASNRAKAIKKAAANSRGAQPPAKRARLSAGGAAGAGGVGGAGIALQAVAGAACVASGLGGQSVDRTAAALADIMAGGDASFMGGLRPIDTSGGAGAGTDSLGSSPSSAEAADARKVRQHRRLAKRGSTPLGSESGKVLKDDSGAVMLGPKEVLMQVHAMSTEQLRQRVVELEREKTLLHMRLSFANRLNTEQTTRIEHLESILLQHANAAGGGGAGGGAGAGPGAL